MAEAPKPRGRRRDAGGPPGRQAAALACPVPINKCEYKVSAVFNNPWCCMHNQLVEAPREPHSLRGHGWYKIRIGRTDGNHSCSHYPPGATRQSTGPSMMKMTPPGACWVLRLRVIGICSRERVGNGAEVLRDRCGELRNWRSRDTWCR